MKILVLEDTPSAIRAINSSLDIITEKKRNLSLSVIECYSIYQANEALRNNADINLIITDLNMTMRGLKKESYQKTNNGFLTGWIWCIDNVFSNSTYDNTNIIVFSEYIGLLTSSYGTEEQINEIYGESKRKIALQSKLGYGKESIIKALANLISKFIED